MDNNLLIVGAGGHGRVVADAAQASGKWSVIAFVDRDYPEVAQIGEWQVIGNDPMLGQLHADFPNIVVAIGDNVARLHLSTDVEKLGFQLATVVHPSAVIGGEVRLGKGSVVFAGAVINYGAVLGRSCIVNTASTIDHDCELGDGVHISPGGHLAGGVCIGDQSWIGIGASVIEQTMIGNDVIVGAGAVVVSDVEDGVKVVGVPAKNREP